jgi:hypothetical protein
MSPEARNSLKAALATGLFTFLATFAVALLGLLSSVTEWINGNDVVITDNLDSFAKLILSAVVAFFAALVNWVWRFAQGKGVPLPGSSPNYR